MGILSFTGEWLLGFFMWLDTSPIGGFFMGFGLLMLFFKVADYISTELHRFITKRINQRGK